MPVNVPPDGGNGKHISVSRMSVGTSEVKDMHVDLLEAVNLSIQSQTEDINKKLGEVSKRSSKDADKAADISKGSAKEIVTALREIKQINEELIAAVRGQGGGEEGGGGDSIAAAELKTHQKALEFVNRAADGNLKYADVMNQMTRLVKAEWHVAFAGMIEAMIDTSRSVVSFRTAIDEVTKKFRQTMELSRSGIADFSDVWLDNAKKVFTGTTQLWTGAADNLMETTVLIKESLESGLISPMQLVEGNLNDVAREFGSLRREMESGGLDLYRNLGFREQNAVFSQLLDAQLRGDRMTDIRDANTRQMMADQIGALRLISENTGMSLDVLVDSNKDTLKSLADIAASGVLTQEQTDRLGPALAAIQASSKEGGDLVTRMLEAGGNIGAFAAADPKMFADMQKANATGLFETVRQILNDPSIGATEAGNLLGSGLQELGDSFKQIGIERKGFSQGFFDNFEYIRDLTSGINRFKPIQEGRGKDTVIGRAFNKFENFVTNNLPIADVAKFFGSIAFNTLAVGANTLALWANTKSRSLGAAGGMMGKFKGVMGLAGKALKVGGIAGGVAMAGKDLYDVATGDASGENLGGVIGGAIGGGIGALLMPFLGPLGIAGGLALGNMAGNWIGGKFDSPGSAASAPSVGAVPMSPAITAPQLRTSMTNTSSQTTAVNNMVTQTRLLTNIADHMAVSNGIQRDIRDRIGFGNGSSESQARDSTRKGSNIAVVPGVLGS